MKWANRVIYLITSGFFAGVGISFLILDLVAGILSLLLSIIFFVIGVTGE